jgi:hypothetical protein
MSSVATQPTLFTTDARSASFYRRRIYRYALWRRWSDGPRYVNFICLNPSTADENTDDPTVRKCAKFACTWGYDAVCITNLFAYKSDGFRDVVAFKDPVGLGNDRWIRKIAIGASLVVCAWGLDGSFMGRGSAVKRLLYNFDLHYLRIGRGQPWHPLYLPDNLRPSRWPRKDR